MVKACKSRRATDTKAKTHQVSAEAAEQAEATDRRGCEPGTRRCSIQAAVYYVIGKQHKKPIITTVKINHKPVRMKIDIGESVSLVYEQTFQRLWSKKDAPGRVT